MYNTKTMLAVATVILASLTCLATAADHSNATARVQQAQPFHVVTTYSRLLANDGSDFFGLQAGYFVTPNLIIRGTLLQSLSSTETARFHAHHETFVQRLGRAIRLEFEGAYRLHTSRRAAIEALGGVGWWNTQLNSTIEDTPMGDFYNFEPITATSPGAHAGAAAVFNFSRHFALTGGARYVWVPTHEYRIHYDVMGMQFDQVFNLDWTGWSLDAAIRFSF